MPEYRRNRVEGGTYFFTVNLSDRASDLLVREITALRQSIRRVRRERPFTIDAFVVLPDHFHCIWTLPPEDSNFSTRMQAIKARFTLALPREQRGVWQKRFWEHMIRNERDFRTHMDDVHFNPVKHGYVPHPGLWPHSTFQACVAAGFYEASWAKPATEWTGAAGEREQSAGM